MESISYPKVSIIIPMYNQERYIKSCLQSVTSQSYENLEIIIVNDGSTDNSLTLVKNCAAKEKRLKIINKMNEGPSLGRKDGYLSATGEFICFVDSDDLLPDNAIKSMLDCILKEDADLVIGKMSIKSGPFIKKEKIDKSQLGKYQVIRQPELYDDYYIGFFGTSKLPVSAWGRVYRKSVIDKAYNETTLFSERIKFMGEDEYLNLKLFPYLKSMCFIQDYVYIYRQGGGTQGMNRHFTDLFILSEERLSILDHSNYEKAYKPLFIEYVNCFYTYAEMLMKFGRADKDEIIDFFKNEILTRSEFISRMAEYFLNNKISKDGAELIMHKDYEAMYKHTKKLAKIHYGSFMSRLKRVALKVFSYFGL